MNSPYPSTGGAKGLEALRRGDAKAAFELLDAAVVSGDSNEHVLMGLAVVARSLSNYERCLSAIDRYLKQKPESLEANLIKADAFAALGKQRAATSFYMAALRLSPPPDQLPPELRKDVMRAKEACERAQSDFAEHFHARLKNIGLAEHAGRSRVEQAVDILTGRKQVFLQQPQKFYLPELPQIQFYDAYAQPWSKSIRDGAAAIKSELTALIAGDDVFEPYMTHNPIAPVSEDLSLNENQQWSSFHLYRDGHKVSANMARCPNTLEILSNAPIARIPGRSPNILFSRLAPGAHIPAHHGQMNVRLLCHLPLVVPKGCQLRVGNQIRDVVEGELMLFDDSIEHEARNTSSEDRIVLIFDIWRPELSEEERAQVCAIFEAIEALE